MTICDVNRIHVSSAENCWARGQGGGRPDRLISTFRVYKVDITAPLILIKLHLSVTLWSLISIMDSSHRYLTVNSVEEREREKRREAT
ncbi:hypothetical protein PUN28_016240 [Cardiocondyla obscurior]|uniref:Uncharacterized protein n=1 Tax=Cardiocondyla obscurior TaxID=286306 RepID=A0AAW2ERK0_9HYME